MLPNDASTLFGRATMDRCNWVTEFKADMEQMKETGTIYLHSMRYLWYRKLVARYMQLYDSRAEYLCR